MKVKEYSLREKKYARTKIAIMKSFMGRLRHTRFDDISIKEVCRDLEVAEGTFFNYFPEKIDVIRYYLSLNILKIIWEAKREVPAGRYLSLIDVVFNLLSQGWDNDNLTYQIISVLLVRGEEPGRMDISGIEKKLAFPDCPGIEEAPSEIISEWFKECVILAQKNGEVSSKINIDDAVVSLVTIMTGTMLAIRFNHKNSSGYHYMRQLHALWRDLGVKSYARQ